LETIHPSFVIILLYFYIRYTQPSPHHSQGRASAHRQDSLPTVFSISDAHKEGGIRKSFTARPSIARSRPLVMTTNAIPHPSPLARRLLGDHKDHSSTITAMAQSADPNASTTTNLFPTTTAGRGDSVGGPGSANVYYLVVSPSSLLPLTDQSLMTSFLEFWSSSYY